MKEKESLQVPSQSKPQGHIIFILNSTRFQKRFNVSTFEIISHDRRNYTCQQNLRTHQKKNIHLHQVDFIPEICEWLNKCYLINVIYHINTFNEKTTDHLIRCRKDLWQKSFMIKVMESFGEQRIYLNKIKAVYNTRIASFNLNGDSKHYQEQDKVIQSLHIYLIQYSTS